MKLLEGDLISDYDSAQVVIELTKEQSGLSTKVLAII